MGRPAHPPADDAAGIGIDDKGDIGEISLSGHVGSRATFRSSAGDKSAATVGLPATLAAISSGIGSSLALIRKADRCRAPSLLFGGEHAFTANHYPFRRGASSSSLNPTVLCSAEGYTLPRSLRYWIEVRPRAKSTQ